MVGSSLQACTRGEVHAVAGVFACQQLELLNVLHSIWSIVSVATMQLTTQITPLAAMLLNLDHAVFYSA